MLRLSTLGALDVRDDRGHPIRDVLRQPKRMALLVYLAVEGAGAPISREKLLAMFWPESDTEHARNALSQLLHQLRSVLGREAFESQGTQTLRVSKSALWCDAVVFLDLLARGDMEMAVDLYRGEFCPALNPSGSADLEHWFEEQRRHLRTRALAAMSGAAERLAVRRDREGAILLARRALAEGPDDDVQVRALLSLLHRQGDGAGALHAYASYARRLHADLDASPDAATRELVEQIRRDRNRTPTPSNVDVQPAANGVAERADYGETPRIPTAEPGEAWKPSLTAGARRPARVVALGLVILLAGVSGALALRDRSAVDGRAHTIAVFPFEVRGGSELSYLGRGIVDLLGAKLDGAAGFNAIDPRSAIAAISRNDITAGPAHTYANAARGLGAGRYVAGNIVGVGEQVHLNASLHDASDGSRLAAANVAGPRTEVLGLVDRLTGRLLAGLIAGRDTNLTRLSAVTTQSLPALIAFLEGEEALRAGRDARAISAFREATSLDSTFALAQYRLSISASWTTVPEDIDLRETAEKAVRHSQRLTPLGRDMLAALLMYRAVRPDEAERAYRAIASARPDNFEAWYMLGETQFHYNFIRARPAEESRVSFERALRLNPQNAHVFVHLARLAALRGDGEALDSLVRSYLSNHRDEGRALEMRALLAFGARSPEAMDAVAAGMADADDAVSVGVIQAALNYVQNFEDANRLVHGLSFIRTPYYRGIAARLLTETSLARGQLSRARSAAILGRHFDADWWNEGVALLASIPDLLPRRMVSAIRDSIARRANYPAIAQTTRLLPTSYGAMMQTYLVGVLGGSLGDTGAVARALRVTESARSPADTSVAASFATALRAELARVRGDTAAALRELDQFAPRQLVPSVYGISRWGLRERFLRAELLKELGRDSEALRAFGALEGAYDMPLVALSHLRRAQLHERLGDRDQAAFHYDRFVAMWRDCDPEFRTLLANARAARITGRSGARF